MGSYIWRLPIQKQRKINTEYLLIRSLLSKTSVVCCRKDFFPPYSSVVHNLRQFSVFDWIDSYVWLERYKIMAHGRMQSNSLHIRVGRQKLFSKFECSRPKNSTNPPTTHILQNNNNAKSTRILLTPNPEEDSEKKTKIQKWNTKKPKIYLYIKRQCNDEKKCCG